MILIFNKSEIDREFSFRQLEQIQWSHFVFVINPEENEYECIKNRTDGKTYFGDLEDFFLDLADRVMFFEGIEYDKE